MRRRVGTVMAKKAELLINAVMMNKPTVTIGLTQNGNAVG